MTWAGTCFLNRLSKKMISRHLLIALADHHQKEAEIAAKVMAIDPKDDAGRAFLLGAFMQKNISKWK